MWLVSESRHWQAAQRLARISTWLLIPLYPLVAAALYAAFLYAPTEKEMGEVQRIFYFHVGAAWTAFLAFFVVFVAGILYLATRKLLWDHLAAASAEIGVVLTSIVLVMGSLWARPIWNTWWPWGDPRVMTTFVLWLTYVAYLILRSSIPESEKRYRFCAVFGILGFLNVPIVWMSIRWWRTIHPVVIKPGEVALDPQMWEALWVAFAAVVVLYLTLLCQRTAGLIQDRISDELAQELAERGSWGKGSQSRHGN